MDECDAYELLLARYGARRARSLLGAPRVLALYGEDEARRRGLISPGGLEIIRGALYLAGVPWPSPGEDQEATRAGE